MVSAVPYNFSVNNSKCKGLWCGSLRHRADQLYGFDWYNDYIPDEILGQYFGNIDCSRRNWEEKIQKINNIIGAWCHRDLSLKGRALLINSRLTSTFWYYNVNIIGCTLLGHFSNRACDLWFLLEKQASPCQQRHLGATPEGGWC